MSLSYQVNQVRKGAGSDWHVIGEGRGLGVFPDSVAAVASAIAQARAALVHDGRGSADIAVQGTDGAPRSIRLVAFARAGLGAGSGGTSTAAA